MTLPARRIPAARRILSAPFLATVLLTTGGWLPLSLAAAAEPEIVGAVALLLDPANRDRLRLTDDQRASLDAVADDREMQGFEIAMQVKNLPAAERAARLGPFREESVRLALELLTPKQREVLAELRAEADSPFFKPPAAESASGTSESEPPAPASAEPAEVESPRPDELDELDKPAGTDGDTDSGAGGGAETEIPAERLAPNAPVDQPTAPIAAAPPLEPGRLSFNFRYQPWQDVLDWFAEQADLSLVLEAPPAGTFNYRDNRSYAVGEALDVLNSVLLTKGYTLVRKGRMLLLVNLEDGIPPNLVTDVPLAELDRLGEYELVRVLFRVRNMLPDEAAEELEQMMGPQGEILVLPKAGMIQVTETAGRIRTLRAVIEAIEAPQDESEADLQEFRLRYAAAAEALPVLKQLLGIPDESMATPTGSLQLAVGPLGSKLFAQGSALEIKRLEEILRLVDVPEAAAGAGVAETPQLEVYPIATIDPELVLNVLKTILGGNETTRIATDAQTGNLVALATASEHATIRATLQQMQQDSRRLEVIPLQAVDPSLAVLAINKLFGVPTAGEDPDPRAPIVDADLSTSSLLVRASPAQITQIKDFLDQLGEGAELAVDEPRGNVRILSIDPSSARSALPQIEQLWPMLRPNRIRLVTPSASGIPSYKPSEREPGVEPARAEPTRATPDPLERLFQGEGPFGGPAPADAGPPVDRSASPTRVRARLVSQPARDGPAGEQTEGEQIAQVQTDQPGSPPPSPDPPTGPTTISRPGADIIIAPGPTGTIIASADLEALDAFEQLLRNSVGQASAAGQQFAVFYLKYAEATTAAETLAKVFGASSGGGGSLIDGMADAALGGLGGGLMGDLLGLGGGGSATAFSSASVDIVPDVRLNALVVYARPTDLDTIDQLLRVLDQRTGPEPVEAGGKPRLIPVVNTSAAEIAEVVKQVFSDRVQSSGGGGRQPSAEDLMRALRRGAGGGGGGSTDQEPSKMTIGVDTRSNSLVVRAPDPLFDQVEQLVRRLDEDGAGRPQATSIVSLKHTNADALRDTLTSLLGPESISTSSGDGGDRRERGAQPRNRERDSGGNNADAARETMQRIELFRRMREMQQRGGGGRGGRGPGGGGPGGGGPGGGGRGRGGGR